MLFLNLLTVALAFYIETDKDDTIGNDGLAIKNDKDFKAGVDFTGHGIDGEIGLAHRLCAERGPDSLFCKAWARDAKAGI